MKASIAAATAASAAERRALSGAPGLGLALAGGAAAALAHPPFGIWPGIFGFGLMLHALDTAPASKPLRAAFFRGWAAGFGYLLIGTWWIAEAFFVDPVQHGWQAPFAVLFTAGGISLFWGAAGLAYRLIAPPGAVRVLTFAAVLTVFEWLRGHVLTGFPWDLPGECWRAGSAPSQAAALMGAYGLSLVTIAIGASAVVLVGPDGLRARIATLSSAALALALLWGGGAWRLSHAVSNPTPVRLRIVQPDLGEEAGWSAESARSRLERYLQMTALPAAHRPDIVIWPEGAVPYSFNDLLGADTWTLPELEAALQPGQVLLAGGFRVTGTPDQPVYFNTLMALQRTPDGVIPLAAYDKHRLVPFGEFLPLRPLFSLFGVTNLIQAGLDFTPGPKPAPIAMGALPRVQPLICYESLFPGLASDRGGRPAWIINVSDDAWFGRTTGPLQHLNLASYRAIEAGLPLVRSTPTGVSALIDGYGRKIVSLGLGQAGVVDAVLPGRLTRPPYARFKNGPLYVLWLLAFSPGLIIRGLNRRTVD